MRSVILSGWGLILSSALFIVHLVGESILGSIVIWSFSNVKLGNIFKQLEETGGVLS